jgi:hypothetical protein
MSTKTSFKRIALVAAAALAIGGFSAVSPAYAGTNAKIFCDLADGLTDQSAPTATNDECNGVAGPANFVRLQWHNTGAAPVIGERLTISGAGATFSDPASAKVSVPLSGLTATVVADGSTGETIQVNTPTVGTVVVSRFAAPTGGVYSTTAVETVTITVNAAAISGGVNAATSTSLLKGADTWSSVTVDDKVLASATASATAVAVAKVALTQVAGAITGTTAVTVSVAGPGVLTLSTATNLGSPIGTGRSLSSTRATTGETFYVGIAPDGTPGVATITITAGTYTATETVTFYGTVASLKATPVRGSIADTHDGVGAGDTAGYAAVITGADSAGNAVPVSGFTAVTAAQLTAAGITAAGFATANAGTYSGTTLDGTELVVVIDPTATKTGAKSLTVTHTASKLTVTVPFTVGLVKATTVSLTADKASYTAGEKMVLTLTALGSDGIAIADTSAATGLLATGGIASSLALQGDTTTATNPALVGGKKSWTLYAPLAAGPLTFEAKTGAAGDFIATAGAAAVVAATAEITGDSTASLALDAANAATDAANNAYDEAQNATQAASDALAAVTALAKQVKSLIASVKKLTAAVAKLR